MATLKNPITIQHPLCMAPPKPTHNPLNPTTLFWCTISTFSTLTALISLSCMACFSSPILILTSLLTTLLHVSFFSNLARIAMHPFTLKLARDGGINGTGLFVRIIGTSYPGEASVEVVVFYVALAVDVWAIAKLVVGARAGARYDGGVLYHLHWICAARVYRLCVSRGWGDPVWLFRGLLAFEAYNSVLRGGLWRTIREWME